MGATRRELGWRPVPRRIDVELTSAQPDGSFTWRAAGAKQPKGVVDGTLLYEGAKVGDVVRAEATFDIDGVVVTSVAPPPHVRTEKVERIEIVGSGRDDQSVTPRHTAKSRGRDGERRGERGGDRAGGRDGDGSGRRTDRPSGAPRPDRRDRRDRPGHADRPDRPNRDDRGERRARPPAADRSTGAAERRAGRQARPDAPSRPRPRRLAPGSAHRNALLDTLPPEQRVIAEQLFRGGIPAVRAAIRTQNDARPEGSPPISAEPLVALAEELLPRVREADWRDRAEAARGILDEVGLRDLRAVVTASDAAARGDEARRLAAELREGLERRLASEREEWLGEIVGCLGDGRVVRALRLSARPPDPATKLEPELLERLSAAAGEAMAPGAPADQWGTLLEAVVASPVRRTVRPAGLPQNATPALLSQAKQAVGRVPALSSMLGVDMPPPPGRRPVPAPPRPAGPSNDAAPAGAAAAEALNEFPAAGPEAADAVALAVEPGGGRGPDGGADGGEVDERPAADAAEG